MIKFSVYIDLVSRPILLKFKLNQLSLFKMAAFLIFFFIKPLVLYRCEIAAFSTFFTELCKWYHVSSLLNYLLQKFGILYVYKVNIFNNTAKISAKSTKPLQKSDYFSLTFHFFVYKSEIILILGLIRLLISKDKILKICQAVYIKIG